MIIVKGISKQVIVVEPKDDKLYDQAIFILSESAIGQKGITEKMLLKDAEGYLHRKNDRKLRRLLWSVVYMLIGAFGIGVVWFVTTLL